jgi:hypothetical protein
MQKSAVSGANEAKPLEGSEPAAKFSSGPQRRITPWCYYGG